MTRLNSLRWAVAAVIALVMAVQSSSAQQLSQEMRDIFNEMMPRLDAELKNKLQQALELEHDFIELTPDQFKRFRDHPANPFEGWQGIDPDSIDGLIRLQFETQPIRSRTPSTWERQAESQLDQLADAVATASAATVRITNGQKQVALGTIVSSDGHVVTKLSEVEGHTKLVCRTFNKESYSAKIIASNAANDIALLKVEADRLPYVTLDGNQPSPGAIIISTRAERRPLAMGTYSNSPRSLIGTNQAFLGVKPIVDPQGLKIIEVTQASAAEHAGLRTGDIVTAIDGKRLANVSDLVNRIRAKTPGDTIFVEYLRDGQSQEMSVALAGRNVAGPAADQFKMMETFGAIPSKRRDEFPLVFQHDTPLLPEQCGGPVTDLHGHVVGINIARGGRVASYAIPAKHVKNLIGEMLRPNVASKDMD